MSSTDTLITNIPKREESKAKRHFERITINEVVRWKCKYCITNYGLNTSTSSLWKHLECKHFEKLNPLDIKQKSRKVPIKGSESKSDSLDENAEKQVEDEIPRAECSPTVDSTVTDIVCSSDQRTNDDEAVLVSSTTDGKRKNSSDDELKINFCSSSGREHFFVKRRFVRDSNYERSSGSISSTSITNDQPSNFTELVSDIATLQPNQFEAFQNMFVQSLFFQMSPLFPLQSINVLQDNVLTRQREKVIDLALHQCGWKFDLNVYPVSLRQKNYLIMDIVYRSKSLEHQACFLDCIEIPDQYPMELLSVMIFRKLCEFRMEDKLWELFIGDSSLKDLAKILQNIFKNNRLSGELEHRTVDFYRKEFTHNPEDHVDCMGNLTYTLETCIQCLHATKSCSLWLKSWLKSRETGCPFEFDVDFGIFSIFQSSFSVDVFAVTFEQAILQNVSKIRESLSEFHDKSSRHFQGELNSIRKWTVNHVFLAYHMVTYCYYLVSEIKSYKLAIDEASNYIGQLVNQIEAIRKACYDSQNSFHSYQVNILHSLIKKLVSVWQIDRLVRDWIDIIQWWHKHILEYQELRHKVLHFVSSNDNISFFANQFSILSQTAPQSLSEDKWMKYVAWKIWKNFEASGDCVT